jgi:hypothetical protein
MKSQTFTITAPHADCRLFTVPVPIAGAPLTTKLRYIAPIFANGVFTSVYTKVATPASLFKSTVDIDPVTGV